MSRRLLFWILMVLWAIFGLFVYWPSGAAGGVHAYLPLGGNLLLWILLALLGWKVFGPILQE